jgi:hypothetical protein
MTKSLEEVNQSVSTLNKKSVFENPCFWPLALVIWIGNWATDIAGGIQFGYALLWVLLMSNIMALLLQSLAPDLELLQRDLAQASEKPIRHLSIIYCIFLPKLPSQPAILPRFWEWQSVSIYCLIFR